MIQDGSYITANLYCIGLSVHVLKQMQYRFPEIYETLSMQSKISIWFHVD